MSAFFQAGTLLAVSKDSMLLALADGFDFPVGKPDANNYRKARGFYPNHHVGEDWNGKGGGDTDKGDPIYSIGRGVVVLSEDIEKGWGNVVIVRHAFRDTDGAVRVVDSLYGHLLERKVKLYDKVERGQLVGTMGSNRGMYYAHLHFEIRKNLDIGMNRRKFKMDYSNYYSPTSFIKGHRKLSVGTRSYSVPVDTFEPYDVEAARKSFVALSDAPIGVDIPLISEIKNRIASQDKKKLGKDMKGALERALADRDVKVLPEAARSEFWKKLRENLSHSGSKSSPAKSKANKSDKAGP